MAPQTPRLYNSPDLSLPRLSDDDTTHYTGSKQTILMASTRFLSNESSVLGSDTVTWRKLLDFNEVRG